MKRIMAVLATTLVAAAPLAAQAKKTEPGPVIQAYGDTYPVPEAGLQPPADMQYKVVFLVTDAPDKAGAVNFGINSAARFINMHVRAGVPLENIHVAVVVHGPATRDVLNEAAFQERYHADNQNVGLIKALTAVGTKLYVCGQSAGGRGIGQADLADGVTLALSAMTAMVLLKQQGYVEVN